MKRPKLLLLLCTFATLFAQAQSKVFKEVSEEISSQIRIIKQDNALVGYLAFTQLEKASEDSFNYELTIMDENLNDVGKIKFKDENLDLQAVGFEQDVLCLAFLKSNAIGKAYKNNKEYNAIVSSPRNAVVTRFLSLDGKTLATNNISADIEINKGYYGKYVQGSLKQGIQLRNVPQKGFTLFYGDENHNNLLAYDLAGKQLWKKEVAKFAKGYYLLSSADGAYLLTKKVDDKIEGGYEISGYAFADNTPFDKYALKDKKGASLKVLGFDNDPMTGKPYVTGMIINPERNGLYTLKDLAKQPYTGVFTIHFNGPTRADVKETYSYYKNDNTGLFKENGKFVQSDAYSLLDQGFKDYNGNTYFVGSSVTKKPKWGSIISSVVLAPLIVVSPMILAVGGTQKCKTTDALILKQSPDGKLSYDNTIPCNYGSSAPAKAPIVQYGPRKNFYRVTNSTTKSDYVIVDDIKDIVIYNVTEKKVVRTIPHKDGNTRINIYPAKEGHIMVSEYNKKEKYTRFSIESL